MKRKNMTRNALFTSIISLLLCVSMLVGTTFAWFTDSVASGVNTIAAGNLDVELYHGKDQNPIDEVKNDTLLFTDVGGNVIDLWEPGVVAFTNLKVANVGTLALKYQLSVNSTEVNYVTTAEGAQLSLADALKVAVVSGGVSGDRASVIAAGETAGWQGLQSFTKSGVLEGDETSQTYGIVIYWQPGDNSHDNLFNMNNGKVTSDGNPLKITLGVNLFATQEMYEDDSFGPDYDEAAKLITSVATLEGLFDAIEAGNNVMLEETIAINASMINYMKERYPQITAGIGVDGTIALINGNGIKISRTAAMKDKPIFAVDDGYGLNLSNITVDGGAVWSGEVDPVLRRGTVNSGLVTSAPIITATKNGQIVLNSGAVLQNNDGANAVNLGTRTGNTLTVNGGFIINNNSAAGAIWGGGHITIDAGSKISGNSSTGIAGAIRMVSNCNLTMNGGEISNNKAATDGGAIWGYGASTYYLKGGKMSNNSAAVGGAIYTGDQSTINISGDFEMSGNTAGNSGAIRFTNRTTLNMTGGKISGNTSTDNADYNGFYGWNVAANITGGEVDDNFTLASGLYCTLGGDGITGEVNFSLGTNHNTALLAENFGTIKFHVDEGANFANFNLKPAAGYTYNAGDEGKLICLNAGYSTYWDAATGTFRLQAN